jgi:hypothetical protein
MERNVYNFKQFFKNILNNIGFFEKEMGTYLLGRFIGWRGVSTCHYILFEWETCMFIRKLTFHA